MNAFASRFIVVAALFVAVVGTGCGPAHIASYVPKERTPPTMAPPNPAQSQAPTSGSLFAAGAVGAGLFVDARAYRVNDIVVVRVEEVADAERTAGTDTTHNSKVGGGISGLPVLGPIIQSWFPGAPVPGVDVEVGGHADSSFSGSGQTGRTERLVATVSTVVKSVMPNGNLFVEGHRVILVNREEQHLYVSGIVRPIDINDENAIDSSRVAEAHIEFVGQGVVSDAESPGLIQRGAGQVNPF